MILVIPSIDLRGGKCCRTVAGVTGEQEVYSADPVQTAILWRGENARMLHVADLDGAFDGEMKNLDVIKEVIRAVDVPVQVSGGVRAYYQVETIVEAGAARVVISAQVNEDTEFIRKLIEDFGPRKIVVGVDAKSIPSTTGTAPDAGVVKSVSIGKALKAIGLERALFSDTSRDGTLRGPNFEGIKRFAVETRLKVTASGGISGYPDLRRMQELEPFGVDSVIIGRALYENRFPCQELWRRCELELSDLGPTRRI
jgi:phosphoribosylformimino-5-aminoimidazole carboxamide ribotide isomerase